MRRQGSTLLHLPFRDAGQVHDSIGDAADHLPKDDEAEQCDDVGQRPVETAEVPQKEHEQKQGNREISAKMASATRRRPQGR